MKRYLSLFMVSIIALTALLGASFGLSGTVMAQSSASGHYQAAIPTPTNSPTSQATSPFSTIRKMVSLTDLGQSNDETLQGVLVSRSYGFRWPSSWETLPGNAVTIIFSHAPALASYSSMAVDFNGIRIGSIQLTPDNSDQGIAKFAIPSNAINVGDYNTLTLQFYMGINENYCDDFENPGVWATIHSTTFFDLLYQPVVPAPELSLYPFPLLQGSELVVNQLTIVTPDKPSVAELTAIAVISAKLGQLNTFFDLNVDVIPESRLATDNIVGNIMYVGQADNLRVLNTLGLPIVSNMGQKISFVSLDGTPLDPDDGILWEDVSPSDPTAVRLVVTGQTENALVKAARGLANDSVYPRLAGQLGVIKNVAQPLSVSNTIKPKMTFSDLGYPDSTARGTREGTISYILPLSREWQVYTEATLDLHFAHSALLYPQGSTLSASINGTPVGSVLLNAENVQDGQVTFRIPARLFEIGFNTITITADLQLPFDPQDQYFCDEDNYNDAWVTVYSDSTLNLPGGPTALVLDLGNYPFGYTGLPDLSDLAFVVPDTPASETAQAIAWVAARLGRYTQGQELSPKVISASNISNIDQSNFSQILIGRPSDNSAIYPLSAVLPLPFVAGQDTPQNPDTISEIVPATGRDSVGYIQSALTDDNQPRLIVTGNSTEGVLWAAKALNDQTLLNQLKDNLAIIQSPTLIYTTSINQRVAADIPIVPPPTSSSNNLVPASTTTWILWLAGGLLLVTLLFLFISIRTTLFKRR